MNNDTIQITIVRDLGDKELKAEFSLTPENLASLRGVTPGKLVGALIDRAIADMDASQTELSAGF